MKLAQTPVGAQVKVYVDNLYKAWRKEPAMSQRSFFELLIKGESAVQYNALSSPDLC